MRFNLRLQTWDDVQTDRMQSQLTIPFYGSWEQCNSYAVEAGYSWKSNNNFLFSGYWRHNNGNCLLPEPRTL